MKRRRDALQGESGGALERGVEKLGQTVTARLLVL